ncbi:MAG: hypothetical protein COW01_00900 [Bdellovibrionales bacterium CG12_big_fil_rev_8_21_14_0_65_38_15]|nr:MAG: hypothetical protein COW79_05160 [Bdellovibrionales bacterium CG22_combo_CG10-13_8_21_14_all_38_13]PIQ57315.1 MAG: hypothetical protein COW01_00900 [Bdellovibrionales bacterium CG12_big_fil_rev_8_21_14_0_65_38_15]PIR28861.1 MAG: hypothetical protein COV38_13490 [Bdellovibrionales bacterium CG11_big_fil_rev_8_21_14_0_20_38_13]
MKNALSTEDLLTDQHAQEFKIVVVDDAEFSRRTTAKILEDAGYNVVGTAGSSEDGLRVFGTVSSISLFIIDVVMPGSSGLQLAQRLNENKFKGAVIMMSSLTTESVMIEALSVGAVDFLKKPFSPQELLKAVEKIEIEHSKDRI